MVTSIYVIYDSRCGLCSRARAWMEQHSSYVPIVFLPAGSAYVRSTFPELESEENPEELLVVSGDGDVYSGDAAWIVCFWALVDYRPWAHRFARGPLRHLARKAWGFLSSNRAEISRMLALQSDSDLARNLSQLPDDSCEVH